MDNFNYSKDLLREKIYLAALLHDIGKFYQRGDKPLFRNGKRNDKSTIQDVSFALAQTICPPTENGKFGYHHVVWTSNFFEKKVNVFKSLSLMQNVFDPSKEIDDNLINLSVNHHRPQSLMQSIITMADGWSSGIDRTEISTFEKEEATEEKNIKWGKDRYKKIPLYSVFNRINEGDHNNAFKIGVLSIDEDIFTFPVNVEDSFSGNDQERYLQLWEKFDSEFNVLPMDSVQGFTESLLCLLKKYTWAIPSNTMDSANVSLYEHLKTTAALADCLYCYYLQHESDFVWNNGNKRLKIKEGIYPVMLVGCDISGIQKFIYNISSSKAAQSLKGRSFYVQLLIDSIIQKIITDNKIQATTGHVIYSSGGVFYMLLPNNEEVKDSLRVIKEEIEEELWTEHKGQLFVNFATIPFAYKNKDNSIGFSGGTGSDLGSLWKELAGELAIQKRHKFKNLLINKFDEFFNPQSSNLTTGGDVEICAVTGEELSKNRQRKLDNGTVVSETVKKQAELGKTLKDADYLITFREKNDSNTYFDKASCAKMKVAGIDNYLFNQKELAKDDTDFRKITSSDVSQVKKFNNPDFLHSKIKGQKVSYGFQFYGGNKQAVFNGKQKTFEELALIKPENKEEQTYFGILRMDVDNLGSIFINGLPEKQRTFAAYATLSFQLDLFFSGYLNTIREKYKDWVNILYSGGDDVFAVGRWREIIEFAANIRKDFQKFTGRDDISISGGIAIVNDKFPIAKAAELAGEAENTSKEFENKNAITFLGETVSWNGEFERVQKLKDTFVDLINNENMSRAILHKLMQFAGIRKNNKKKLSIDPTFKPDLSYKWNTAYYLKRFRDRAKNERITEFIKKLEIELFANNGRNYELVALAARWAELETRFLITKSR